MQKKIKFDEGGLKTFGLVVLSCYPVHQELNANAMAYLKSVVDGEEFLDCKLLLKKLPALEESLFGFAKQGGYERLSAELVAEFFSSKDHYEKILQEFEDKKLHIVPKSIFSLKTMFAHLVTPLEIVDKDQFGFVGKYVNGQFEFVVRGLVATRNDERRIDEMREKRLQIIVLAHFAAIVAVDPPREFVEQIFELLRRSSFFVSSCKYLQLHDGVDYNVFPRNCCSKTEKVLKNISI